uniref:Telomeric repeat-binding factor n=2 Tax=Pyxicephalus adspersus TaxID=30357 RepID=A0AAV2ZRX0_PYXAD|nr:TPA: hypothetical protein GDO54_002415 [Pyxicephalus adspersus]
MAAFEESDVWALEPVVNQWVLDYFFHLSVLAFRSGRHDDFAELRDIVSVLIQRPFKLMEKNTQVLRILQCLSRIEEGDDPDCTFDQESSETPLESAVEVLKIVNSEMTVDEDVMKTNMQMLKEAAVVACIKKKQFGKASNIMKKYISSSNETKKLRGELQYIISKKNCNHPLIANFSLTSIKEKMYQMFEEPIKQIPCFLMTLAQKNNPEMQKSNPEIQKNNPEIQKSNQEFPKNNPEIQKSNPELNKIPSEAHVSDTEAQQRVEEPPTKDTPRASKYFKNSQQKKAKTPTKVRSETDHGTAYSLSAIKSQWASLCEDQDIEAKFKELCESSFCEQPTSSQTHSVETLKTMGPPDCTPRKDLPSSKEPAQSSPSISLHQLVMEPDSQLDNEIEEERPSKAPTLQEQSTNTTVRRLFNSPTVNLKRKHDSPSKSSTVEEQDTWSEEDELFKSKNQRGSRVGNNTTTNGNKKQKWTVEETEWIKLGVKELGEGNWAKILKRFPFHNRTSVMIKDRWRTMKKLSLV